MKNNKTPLTLRRGFVLGFSIACGALMGGLLNSIGQNAGEYHGMKESHERWKAAIDKVLEEHKSENESKEEE